MQRCMVLQGRTTVPAPTVLPLGVSLVAFRKREGLFSPTLFPIVLKRGGIWRRASLDQDVSPDGRPRQSSQVATALAIPKNPLSSCSCFPPSAVSLFDPPPRRVRGHVLGPPDTAVPPPVVQRMQGVLGDANAEIMAPPSHDRVEPLHDLPDRFASQAAPFLPPACLALLDRRGAGLHQQRPSRLGGWGGGRASDIAPQVVTAFGEVHNARLGF